MFKHNSVRLIPLFGLMITASCQEPHGSRLSSEDAKFAQFHKLVEQTNENQDLGAHHGKIGRGVHNKPHGCLVGELEVLADRPDDTRVGLFRETAKYPVWTRFSNGSPHQRADDLLDSRGLAIKVLGMRSLNSEVPTQDLVMINMQEAPGSSPEAFMDFMMASARGNLSLSLYLAKHPKVAAIWAKAALHRVKSMVNETYWSVTPFGLGDRVMKFNVTPSFEAPCAPREFKRGLFSGKDFLQKDLKIQAETHPICFDISVQLEAEDKNLTPIEDSMVNWPTPFRRVARVVLPAQTFDSPDQTAYCDSLNFTPWHYLPEHEPLSRMNQSRKPVYEGSQGYRHGKSELAPEPESIVTFP